MFHKTIQIELSYKAATPYLVYSQMITFLAMEISVFMVILFTIVRSYNDLDIYSLNFTQL